MMVENSGDGEGENTAMHAEGASLGTVDDGTMNVLFETIELTRHDQAPHGWWRVREARQRSDPGRARLLAGLVLFAFLDPRTLVAHLQLGGIGRRQRNVEHHLGEGPLEAACLDSSGVLDPMPLDRQFLARGEGEVVEDVGIVSEVDLGDQVLVPRRRDEVVDVRRALAVTAEQIEYLLGRIVRRAAIGRRVTRDQDRKRSFIAQPRFAAFQRAGSIRDQANHA